MKLKDWVFLVVMAVIIIPAPSLGFGYMTNKTVWELVYR